MSGDKFCVDCEHHKVIGDYYPHRCFRLDLVTKEPINGEWGVDCNEERVNDPVGTNCGVYARYEVAREQKGE